MNAFFGDEPTDKADVLLVWIQQPGIKFRYVFWVGAGIGDMGDFVGRNAHFDVFAPHSIAWANVVADSIAKGSLFPAAIHNAFPDDAAGGAVVIAAMAQCWQVLPGSACIAICTIAVVGGGGAAEAVIV